MCSMLRAHDTFPFFYELSLDDVLSHGPEDLIMIN
jgi:hypothetical protein